MSSTTEQWALVHLLAEPTRRRVYDAVRQGREPLTRDAVADRVGITRRLAAFHLDLLADGGLLATDYARPPGRSGPGAGRPAKRYAAAPVDVEVSVPGRRYDLAARILAEAIDAAGPDGDARAAAVAIARTEGERIGAARRPGGRPSARASFEAVTAALADLGYEPQTEGRERHVVLRNCPFHAAVDVAPQLVCGVNGALLGGLVDALGATRAVDVCPDGVAPDCCVTLARR